MAEVNLFGHAGYFQANVAPGGSRAENEDSQTGERCICSERILDECPNLLVIASPRLPVIVAVDFQPREVFYPS